MSILADTNILLRRTQPDHPRHGLAVESVARLLSSGEAVYFTLQNMSEFWNVATRPAANNGLGFQGITVQQIRCGAGHRFSWPVLQRLRRAQFHENASRC